LSFNHLLISFYTSKVKLKFIDLFTTLSKIFLPSLHAFCSVRLTMKRFFLILLFIVGALQLTFAEDVIDPKGKIKGAVVDAKSKTPLEYATVALYSADENKLISGTITDYLGHFKLDKPIEGEYYLLISFIGLADEKTGNFTVTDKHSNLNLGNVFLEPDTEVLNEVEIVEKRASIEYKIDKKVINVDKQLTAEAGTAIDVLESVPSVQVDIEGNVTLRGSTGFTVLIDGKPTILDPSDALRQIPSSSIDNIEIITNPSVKYDPEGASGIINIITKKNHLDGLSGLVNLNLGMYGQYGGDFQISYRLSKFNFMLGANYNKRVRPGSVSSERQTFKGDTTFYLNSSGNTERFILSKSIKAGIEYSPTKSDFVSLSGRYGKWSMNNNSNLLYEDWLSVNPDIFSYNSYDQTYRGGTYFSIDGYYKHDFKTRQKENKSSNKKKKENSKTSIPHTLKLELNIQNRDSDEESFNQISDLSGVMFGGSKNIEKGPSTRIQAKADYSLPVRKKGKFEAGLQYRNNTSNEITELYVFDSLTGNVVYVPEFSNTTDYLREIYAAYALYAGMTGNFGFQAGLRTEYTNRSIQMTGEDTFKLNRWDYFPTVHLSYNLPLDQEVMASYSRRINRPRGWQLEPFVTYQDIYNVRQGNPGLKPEYVDSYEFGYLKKFKSNFFSLEAYYRVTHNKIERVSSAYTEITMLHTYQNVGEDFSLGLEGMLNLNVTKWWDLQISGTFYNYKLEGTLYDAPFSKTSTNWNSRLNNTFTIWKNGQLQLNSRYNSASVTAQGTSEGYYTLDAAFKVSFFDRSLSVNVQSRDLLSTAKREQFSEGQDFTFHYLSRPRSPIVAVTISYRFNNFRQNRRVSESMGDGEF